MATTSRTKTLRYDTMETLTTMERLTITCHLEWPNLNTMKKSSEKSGSERFNLWAAHLILGSVILGGASPLLGADRSAIPGAAVQPQSEQVQTSPVQPSDKPEIFGVKPVHVDIHWTAYYVAPVQKASPDKGHPSLSWTAKAIRYA